MEWQQENFKVSIEESHFKQGRLYFSYEFYWNNELLFQGNDLGTPIHTNLDVDVVMSLLGFLTLKPGDTDDEHFERYTESQLEWSESDDCEYLSMLVMEHEESK